MIFWLAAGLVAAAAMIVGYRWGSARSTRRVTTDLEVARAEVARRLEEIYSFQELSFTLSESLQPDRIAERMTAYLKRFLKTDGSLVALTADGGKTMRIAAAEGGLQHLAHTEILEGDSGRLVQAMGKERLELVERGDGDQPTLVGDTTVERAAILPLRAHGVTVGALTVCGFAEQPFSTDQLRLLSTVATHAAIVLSNARFFDLVRAGRDQWETTFNAIAEGIAVVDEGGNVQRANSALAHLLGASVPSLAGTSFVETLGSSPEVGTLIESALRGDPSGVHVEHVAALDRTLRVSAAPMRGPESAAWAVVLVEDVTEEQALESQLIQHEKMAAVGQLVSGIAHELNNPLTSIAGLAEFLLEQSTATEREREHLRVIHEQADRAGRIVRNLLTFARKDAEDIGEVDLNDIVQRTVSLVGYEMRLREVDVEWTFDGELPAIQGDRYELQQVVLNLLTNAAQAVEHNPPDRPRHVSIGTAHDDTGITLRVADSGPGIPDDIATCVFTPFFTTKAPGSGTGLGLSISFQIVQRHGGTLTVRRGVDGGALFEVRLPVGIPAARLPDGAPDSAVTAPPDGKSVSPQRILLLDDDPAVRRMISVILASDATVDAAHGAEDAARKLEERAYDLVIADPRAAVSAGERFGDHLARRWPQYLPRTILVTADVRPETQAWLDGMGCRYFVKPFRIGELKSAAAHILARTAEAEEGS